MGMGEGSGQLKPWKCTRPLVRPGIKGGRIGREKSFAFLLSSSKHFNFNCCSCLLLPAAEAFAINGTLKPQERKWFFKMERNQGRPAHPSAMVKWEPTPATTTSMGHVEGNVQIADEGYGTASNSPDWADSSVFFDGDFQTPCCSLLDDTWTPLPQPTATTSSTSSANKEARRAFVEEILKDLRTPLPLPRIPRGSYNPSPLNTRAILTFDVESINPEDAKAKRPIQEVIENPDGAHFARKPWGIAVNSRTEQIYVADRQYHVVMVFGPDGQFLFQFGGPGDQDGKFNRPTALAYDVTGDRLFVTDKDNHRIQVFDPTGRYLFQFGTKGRRAGCFSWPWGIAISPDGAHVAVADARNHRVQLFKSDGTYLRQFAKFSMDPDCKNYPRGIVFNPTGKYIYLTDFNLHCVFRLDFRMTKLDLIMDHSELSRPSGIDVDASGNIVVCDNRNYAVKVFKPTGQLLGTYTTLKEDNFDLPMDVAVMPAGYIIVLDLNGRVRIF